MRQNRFISHLPWLIPPFLALLLNILQIEELRQLLKEKNPAAPLYIIITISVSSALILIFGAFSPLMRYQRLAEKRWRALETIVQSMHLKYGTYRVSLNIMRPRRRYFYFIEPHPKNKSKKRFTLYGDVFDVVWASGKRPHSKLRITINQGLCGYAYKGERDVLGKKHDVKVHEKLFNFSQEQKNLLRGLKIVVSAPIVGKETNLHGEKSIIIGVLNFESSISSSVTLLNGQEWETLQTELIALAQVCSDLLD